MSLEQLDSSMKRERVIQWDEVTIAEHDKERGTRQKIDEPPTPYRYSSDSASDHSVASESDYESGPDTEIQRDNLRDVEASSVPIGACIGAPNVGVMHSWSTLEAQLQYHSYAQQLQDEADSQKLSHLAEPWDGPVPLGEDPMGIVNEARKAIPVGKVGKGSPRRPSKGDVHVRVGGVAIVDDGAMDGDDERDMFDEEVGADSSIDLGRPAKGKVASPRSSASFEGGDAAEVTEKTDFKNKRAAHYSEFKVLQAMRSRMQHDDEDDDDDDR